MRCALADPDDDEYKPDSLIRRACSIASSSVARDYLERVWGAHPTPDSSRVFLCDNPAMVDDMVAILAEEGFHEHSRKEPGHVFVDQYW